MAEPKAEKPKNESARGSWVVVDDDGVVLVVESSEIKAFRAGQPLRALTVFWPHGAPRAQVITAEVLARHGVTP